MTMGIDRRWRRAAVRAAHVDAACEALDVCCGTGDITFEIARAGAKRTVGVDFSANMLTQARARARKAKTVAERRVDFVQGDALDLPFPTDSFDAVTVSFGVRNVEDIPQAFREFARVVRPGGRVVCLEITLPTAAPSKLFYQLWFHRIVPVLGGWLAGDREAYTYLPESTKTFPQPSSLQQIMTSAGIDQVVWRTFAGGIVALHEGTVGSDSPAAAPADATTADHTPAPAR